MRKSMCILVLVLLTMTHLEVWATTHQSSLNFGYICSYSHIEKDNDDEEFITLDIQVRKGRGQIIYNSSDLTSPVYAPITNTFTKNKMTTLEGTLPSPWTAGSKFQIQLQDNEHNPIYKIKFIVPGVGHLKATPMSCKKKFN